MEHLNKEQQKIVRDIEDEKVVEFTETLNEYEEELNKFPSFSLDRKKIFLKIIDDSQIIRDSSVSKAWTEFMDKYSDELIQVGRDWKNEEDYTKI